MALRPPSPADDARELRLVMQRAIRAARAVVADPPGRTEKAREFAAARAAATMRDLRRDLAPLNARANVILGRQLPAQFARGVQRADKLARDAGLVHSDTPISGALSGAETRRAAVLVRTKQADIYKAFASIGSDNGVVGRAVRQARALGLDQRTLKQILAGGAISGDANTGQAIRKLMRSIGDGKVISLVDKNGVLREYAADDYADLVYATAMAEATNVAEVERLYARGSFYVEVIGSNSENFCTAYVGKVFYAGPGEDPLGHFPRIDKLPRGGAPFHPRCSKRYVPFNVKTASPTKIAAAKLSPDELKTLTGVSATDAQRAYAASKKPKPTPVSKPTPTPLTAPGNDAPVVVIPSTPNPIGEPIRLPTISDLISLPNSGMMVGPARTALELIERVHKLPAGSRPVTLRVIPHAKFEGQIIFNANWTPKVIQIRSTAVRPTATVLHEAGHYFEVTALGKAGNAAFDPAFAEWSEAIRRSDAFARISDAFLRTQDSYLAYLLSPREMFARSYAQWIATRTADVDILKQLIGMTDRGRSPVQWATDDFGDVAAGFDAAIERLGLQP